MAEWYDYASNSTATMQLVGQWYGLRKKVPNPIKGAGAIADLKAFLLGIGMGEQDACLLSTWVGIGRAELAPNVHGIPSDKGDTGFFEKGTKTAEDMCGTAGGWFSSSRTVFAAWQDLVTVCGPTAAVVPYDIAAWGAGKSASALASVKANASQDAQKIINDAVEAGKKAALAAAGGLAGYEIGKLVLAAVAAKAVGAI